MVSRRAARRATALLASVAAFLFPGHAGAQAQRRSVEIVVVPETQAKLFFARHPAALGLGVFPETRDPIRFVEEIGFGAPHGGSISTGEEKPARVADTIAAAGRSIVTGPGSSPAKKALVSALPPTAQTEGPGRSVASLTVAEFERASDLEQAIATAPLATGYVILGAGDRTPLLIGICRSPCRRPDETSGLLVDGIARRPAIVTPYDVGVTVMDMLDVSHPSEAFIGKPLTRRVDPNALRYVEGLERRLVRDAALGSSPAVATDALTVLALVAGLLLLVASKKRLAARAAQAAWSTVAIGYLASLFVPSGSGQIRSVVVVAAFALGASFAPQRDVRTARVYFAVAVATALLFVVAQLNAGGQPGLSIWGNPLTSWRFFGMQNAQAATVAAGVVVWGVLAGLGVAALTAVAILAALIIGASVIGANFVGVLTFTFGSALAIQALARRRVHLVQVMIAGAVAIGAFLLALLADVGSPVSHGGRAAKRISEGGISTAWDFVTGRLRLNVDLVRGFWGGVVWVAVMFVALALMIVWGARIDGDPLRGRVAVWAGAAMALSSLVLEDSGFYSGMTLLGGALAAWIMVAARITEPRAFPTAGDG
jgi:hypothetical protein